MDDQLIYEALKELRGDLKALDEKVDAYVSAEATLSTRVKALCSQVDILNRLLVHGNGQKSVVVQLEHLHTEVSSLHNKLASTKSVAMHEVDSNKQRWIAIGKFVGLLSLAVPGILSLLGFGG